MTKSHFRTILKIIKNMKTKQVIRYACGFLMTATGEFVALIEKTHPENQIGFWNGIGGKVRPGELSSEAMEREFREECSIEGIDHKKWRNFAIVSGINQDTGQEYHIFFFVLKQDFDWNWTTNYGKTDEQVKIFRNPQVNNSFGNNVPNDVVDGLKYLLPMAIQVPMTGPFERLDINRKYLYN